MDLALFDLDHTLLNGDSDHGWGVFLGDLGVVDAEEQNEKQDYFYQEYRHGRLDMQAFLEFQLAPLAQFPKEQLHQWRAQYVDQIIKPMLADGKPELLLPHRGAGDELVIVTATSDFITRPIADLLGVDHLIATQVEVVDGEYTGKPYGTPSFREGKVTRVNQWLSEQQQTYSKTYFYSDSINDLPLLEQVDVPIAVTPDEPLRMHAQRLHWKIID